MTCRVHVLVAIDRRGVLSSTLSGVLRVKLNGGSEERCGVSQHITSVPWYSVSRMFQVGALAGELLRGRSGEGTRQ